MTYLLSQMQVRDALERAGAMRGSVAVGTPGYADILAAVAMCEGARFTYPGFTDFDTVGDVDRAGEKTSDGRTWGPSVTCWQIRTIVEETGRGTTRDIHWLTQSVDNAARAVLNIAKTQGLSAWTMYRNGAFEAYLQDFYPPIYNEYLVVAGDTFARIDGKLDLPKGTIARLNPLVSETTLQIGQALNTAYTRIQVKSGDTLTKLMRAVGWVNPNTASINRVAKFAGLADPNQIQVDQTLKILLPNTDWLEI